MEQRQGEQPDVLLPVPERGAAGVDVEQGVPVGDHRPLGKTRGPRRVQEHGHVVGSRRRRRGDGVRREGVAERKGTFPPALHEEPGPHPPDTFLPGDLFELLRGRHDDRGGAIRQDVGDLGGGKPVIHRHRHAPGRDRPEIRDDELRNVLEQEGDAFPRSDGAGPEEGGEPAATVVQRGVRQRIPRVGDDGRFPAPSPRLEIRNVGDPGERRLPAHHIVHPPST